MSKLLCVIAITLVLPVSAQTPAIATVTYAKQGGVVVKSLSGGPIKGWDALSVVVCAAGSGGTIANGVLVQGAIQQGYSPVDKGLSIAEIQQTSNRNWRNIVSSIISAGSLAVPMGGLSGVIATSKAVNIGMLTGHAFWDNYSTAFLSRGPQPGAIISALLDPTQTSNLTAQNCATGILINAYAKGQKSSAGPITIVMNGVIPAPGPVAVPHAAALPMTGAPIHIEAQVASNAFEALPAAVQERLDNPQPTPPVQPVSTQDSHVVTADSITKSYHGPSKQQILVNITNTLKALEAQLVVLANVPDDDAKIAAPKTTKEWGSGSPARTDALNQMLGAPPYNELEDDLDDDGNA